MVFQELLSLREGLRHGGTQDSIMVSGGALAFLVVKYSKRNPEDSSGVFFAEFCAKTGHVKQIPTVIKLSS